MASVVSRLARSGTGRARHHRARHRRRRQRAARPNGPADCRQAHLLGKQRTDHPTYPPVMILCLAASQKSLLPHDVPSAPVLGRYSAENAVAAPDSANTFRARTASAGHFPATVASAHFKGSLTTGDYRPVLPP
jgi:hypothetical protein